MVSELKECSTIRKGKQETGKSKVEKLKMNPVGDPYQLDCDEFFHFHCSGDSAVSEDFSLLHWDPKRLTAQGDAQINWFGGLVFTALGASNTDVPVACSDICACSFDG